MSWDGRWEMASPSWRICEARLAGCTMLSLSDRRHESQSVKLFLGVANRLYASPVRVD